MKFFLPRYSQSVSVFTSPSMVCLKLFSYTGFVVIIYTINKLLHYVARKMSPFFSIAICSQSESTLCLTVQRTFISYWAFKLTVNISFHNVCCSTCTDVQNLLVQLQLIFPSAAETGAVVACVREQSLAHHEVGGGGQLSWAAVSTAWRCVFGSQRLDSVASVCSSQHSLVSCKYVSESDHNIRQTSRLFSQQNYIDCWKPGE